MEKLCYDKDGCTKNVEKVIVPVCVSVVDKNVKIPLNVDFWVQRKARGKKKYRSKVEIAQELILYLVSKGIEFDFVSLDGAFPHQICLHFFNKTNINLQCEFQKVDVLLQVMENVFNYNIFQH